MKRTQVAYLVTRQPLGAGESAWQILSDHTTKQDAHRSFRLQIAAWRSRREGRTATECGDGRWCLKRRGVARYFLRLEALPPTRTVGELDALTREITAFARFSDMLETFPTYRPTIYPRDARHVALADAYDRAQERRGDQRRAYRGIAAQKGA